MSPVLALAGFGVGVIVGLTGMGGGALMTPVLVLFFGVPPLAAVSSDLVASAVMKPFGSFVHIRRGTVNWRLVGWLCAGSVPSAFAGVLLMRAVGGAGGVQHAVQLALGGALLLAVGGLIVKAYRDGSRPAGGPSKPEIRVRPLPTALLGAVGGLVVGLTSVGSGSLIIVVLLALYPMLRANDLVGTDLVQAVPLVAAAALGHVIFGDFHLDLSLAILVGSIPGVLIGARLSSRAPAGAVRAALVLVLLASALKLFGASNLVVIGAVAAVALAGLVVRVVRRSGAARSGADRPVPGREGADQPAPGRPVTPPRDAYAGSNSR
ncbi:sulfite exporter TauE/SafE family protein [Planosporangium mesophilum]|uniref:Probable membrane transporter protein n=1 Tax=Planosporangium mesophilum TaxID=689768 RepID=A0A8J3TIM4_9ACTN|nr:sulfite exporter TauE/SafE family protein [Planosporangium mesophilum]NJC83725.1 sulfite exporter TauE/SafE family protein [Planosporangium mesophilum]GII26306.1 UPF0721 transmembrane protein [Planosporangium mesophilum]